MIFYRILSVLFFPLIALFIFIRLLKGKEHKARFWERFGVAGVSCNESKIIWLHAVSVGETTSALALLDKLIKKTDAQILFTTTTLASAEMLAKKIPQYNGRLIHQFFPVDSLISVKKFLNFWQPQKALFIESEIWPIFLSELKRRRIPASLINARLSDKSYKKWNLLKKIGINIFNYYQKIFAQSKDDFCNLKEFCPNKSDREIFFFGNIKSQAKTLSYQRNEVEDLRQKIGQRKIFLVTSTHKTEEEKIIKAHKKLREKFPDLLTILVPRHVARTPEILELLHKEQINFAQRSKLEILQNQHEIYFADTMGELGLFYKLCDFAFVAGSFAPVGGHNPYEAIRLDCAVVSGKNVFNFKDIYQELAQKNACALVDDENDLANVVAAFFDDQKRVKKMNEAAKEVVAVCDDIAVKIVERLWGV